MSIIRALFAAPIGCALLASTAYAIAPGDVRRLDAETVEITWTDDDPVTVYASASPTADLATATVVAARIAGNRHVAKAPADKRVYFHLVDGSDSSVVTLAERHLPLQQGSNFRDIGGYATADGRTVKWGRIFRSGAMPMLTDADYAMLESLGIGSIVDLRSTDERLVTPNDLDDRTGALFLTNDYSLRALMAGMRGGDGENMYRGIGKALAPQYRAIFRRLLAGEGATMYHCSAGQDRTGVATALILSALGVPRDTVLADYHLSTQLRRPHFEMPKVDPKDFPGNPIVELYAASAKRGDARAEPLYTPTGQSHLAQFLDQIAREYGSVEAYLEKELGISGDDVLKLRATYLEKAS